MTEPEKPDAHAMWGGRFGTDAQDTTDHAMEAINVSIAVDYRLAHQDIEVSRAHVRMLAACGILPEADRDAILSGLDRVRREIEDGDFVFSRELEDIHMNIEARLTDLIGEPAQRLHTARSRNDQVATDLRIWTRSALQARRGEIHALIRALLDLAEPHADTIMPGFTHMQTAQPISFGHHLLAYAHMFERDAGRMTDCETRLNECPLGAGALAGTSFPIDRDMTARELHFARPMANSLDAVSARDFALEALAAVAICATHMSRLAEEVTLWASPAFSFVRLPDAWSTGSSMMPQKRNPDAAELVRAKTGRITGSLLTLLTVMKALPLAYCKDMQEDKPAVFDAFDTCSLCLRAMTGMIAGIVPDTNMMQSAAEDGFSTATDLADWLVIHAGMPFRLAHRAAGEAVRAAETAKCRLWELPLPVLQDIHPDIDAAVFAILGVEAALARRSSYGGPSPDNVRTQISIWKDKLATAEQHGSSLQAKAP